MSAPSLKLCVPCKVLAVHDGDTATAEIRLKVNVRYANCWAPELSERGGHEARDSAKEAEERTGRLEIPLDTIHNVSQMFSFGRVVGTLWLDGADESESEKQVRLGHASSTKNGMLGE